MSKLINRNKSVAIAARVSKEINTLGEMKFPNTIFLEIGYNLPDLQLFNRQPGQVIEVEKYEEFINAWSMLELDKVLTGLRYPEQIEILSKHLPSLEQHLGLSIQATSAGMSATIPNIKRTYWLDHCYSIDAEEHVSDIFVKVDRPIRIMGECELSPGLIEAISLGIIDPNASIPDIIVGKEHKKILMELAGKDQVTSLEELVASQATSKGLDYSDCKTEEEAIEKFAKHFNLNPQGVKDHIGPRGFAVNLDAEIFNYGEKVNTSYLPETKEDPKRLYGKEAISLMRGLMGRSERLDGMVKIASINVGMQHFQLELLDRHLGMVAHDVDHAKKLIITLPEWEILRYAETSDIPFQVLQFSIQLLRAGYILPKKGLPSTVAEGDIYLLDLFDIVNMGKEKNRDLQRITTLAKHRLESIVHDSSPAHKLGLMKDNVAAHEYYLSEVERLTYYSPALDKVKRMENIFFMMIGVRDISQDQVDKFYFDLGENLVGEIECPVDQGSWSYIQKLLNHALHAVEQGLVHGQDVQELAGAFFNAHTLGDEPLDKSEYVSVQRRDDLNVFHVMPLDLWHRPK